MGTRFVFAAADFDFLIGLPPRFVCYIGQIDRQQTTWANHLLFYHERALNEDQILATRNRESRKSCEAEAPLRHTDGRM